MLNPNVQRTFTRLKLHVPCLLGQHHTCDAAETGSGAVPGTQGVRKPSAVGYFVSFILHKNPVAASFLCSISPENGRGLIPSWLELRMRDRTRSPAWLSCSDSVPESKVGLLDVGTLRSDYSWAL